MNHCLMGLWCMTKSGFCTTTSNDQFSGQTEKKLQSTSQRQTCTKKRSQSLFGGLLPVLSTMVFWILMKTLHVRSMFSKSTRCIKNCHAYSWNWSTEWAQFFSMTMSNHTLHNQHFKSWMNRATEFCLIHHIHLTSCQPTTTSLSILTTSCRENAFQEFAESQNMDFYATGINKLISCWEKCVDYKIPLLINKDMFELSYNDVKFMIQNHNYFFTKLILIYVISTCAVNTKVTATTFALESTIFWSK